jgi:uncharacterized protein
MLSFEDWFATRHATIPVTSAQAVLALSGSGATLPFIARYRKEQTGNLDEVAIQSVLDAKETWDAVQHRKKFICDEIDKQGKLTPELKEKILATYDLERLEDLYLPYKLKRKTKAAIAREAGLEPLARVDVAASRTRTRASASPSRKGGRVRLAREERRDDGAGHRGARDIVIERLSEGPDLRERVRRALFDDGNVCTKKARRPSRTASTSATSPTTSVSARSCGPRRRTGTWRCGAASWRRSSSCRSAARPRTRRSTRSCWPSSSAPRARVPRRRRPR